MRRSLIMLAVLAALLVPAATAAAQALPPSLTPDTRYAFSGIVEHVTDQVAEGSAIDTALDRHYAVGESDGDVVVIARRSSGALDTTFDGDGVLTLPGTGDAGFALIVLPDSRLRIAAARNGKAVVIGRLPDGSPDPGFSVGVGEVPLAGERATGLAADALGRLAVTGDTATGAFVAVLDSAGALAFPLQAVDADGAVDVAWGPNGPVALVDDGGESELHAFTMAGAPDWTTVIDLAGTDTEPGGVLAYGGRLWATGTVTSGGDEDAYLARVDGSGGDLQTRRFDMRGMDFQATEQVNSEGLDLTLVTGEPDTLVVGGSAAAASDPPRVGAAAFNGLDGSVAQLATGDFVVRALHGQGIAVGVAGAGNGVVAVTVDLKNTDMPPDERIGMGRLFVDAEKQCDLALAVVNPVELIMRGTAPSTVTLRATNNGKRACGGEVAVPAPYSITTGTLATGKLAPGGSVVLTAPIAYGATFPAVDTLVFTLSSPTDVQLGDNVARLRVAFSFCDLQLSRIGGPRVIGKEGSRRYEFTVRNVGTATCGDARIAVVGKGRRARPSDRYRVPAGQSVTDDVAVAARKSARAGNRAAIGFIVGAVEDVRLANNFVGARPMVVHAGDTTTRRPAGAKRFRGKAKAGRAKNVRKRTLKVARVEIAVRKRGKRCTWLSDRKGRFRTVVAGRKGACDEPVWVRVSGKRKWRLKLAKALPKGRYTLLSRAVLVNGVPEGAFSRKDRNKVTFRVR